MKTMLAVTLIDKLDALYSSIRSDLTACFETVDRAQAQKQETQQDARLSGIGRAERLEKLDAEIRTARQEAERLARDARDRFTELYQETKKQRGARERARPQDIDGNALALLNSGILTDAELLALADDYSGNMTMCRMIGRYLLDRAEQTGKTEPETAMALKEKGYTLTDTKTPLDRIIDEYAIIFEAGTRADANRANGVDRILYQTAREKARSDAEALDAAESE